MGPRALSIRHRTIWHLAYTACLGIVLALSSTACRHKIDVRAVAAPDASFVGRRTFRILPIPAYRGTIPLATNDPMLVNSITYQAMRDAIRRAFESRGYRYAPDKADLDIAYYVAATPRVEIQAWEYGYDARGLPREYIDVTHYTEGSVIIDVIDPATHKLLWRGQASTVVDTDPDKYIKELTRAVNEIVKKYPAAS
jgi:hypothetical protein